MYNFASLIRFSCMIIDRIYELRKYHCHFHLGTVIDPIASSCVTSEIEVLKSSIMFVWLPFLKTIYFFSFDKQEHLVQFSKTRTKQVLFNAYPCPSVLEHWTGISSALVNADSCRTLLKAGGWSIFISN